MGNASEYKTFNGQIGKGARNFCSEPPRLQLGSAHQGSNSEDIHLRVCDAGREARESKPIIFYHQMANKRSLFLAQHIS